MSDENDPWACTVKIEVAVERQERRDPGNACVNVICCGIHTLSQDELLAGAAGPPPISCRGLGSAGKALRRSMEGQVGVWPAERVRAD